MAPLLPEELRTMIVESTTDISTLRSLCLVSNQFRHVAEPILLRTVTIVVNDHRWNRSRLIPFRDFVTSADGQRCLRVKHLTVSFPWTVPNVSDIDILNNIIPKFAQLKSLSFSIYTYMAEDHGPITLFNNPTFDFSLKHFSFIGGLSDSTPDLSPFLASQASLEHLELSFLEADSISIPAFQHLRHLNTSIRLATAALSSTPGIVSLRTYFIHSPPFDTIPKSHLHFLQTLSCHLHNMDTFSAFMSLATNIKFLEIYSSSTWEVLEAIRGSQVEHIRFVHDPYWRVDHVHEMFAKTSFLPSLRCIEVQKLSQDIFPPRPKSSLSNRWYRAQEEPLTVVWQCPLGEEWFHDWDADVRVLS